MPYRVHVTDTPSDFFRRRATILVAREAGGMVELEELIPRPIEGSDPPASVFEIRTHLVDPLHAVPPGLGTFSLPVDALPALRDALDERLGRRYDENLVAELRAELAVERARVEKLIEKALEGLR